MNSDYPSSSSTTSPDVNASHYGSSVDDMSQDSSRESYSGTGSTKRTGASLRTELGDLKSDLDTLISRATNLSDAELHQEYARLMAKFSSLRAAAKGVASQAGQQLNRGMDATSGYVREKPLQSVAVATGLGMMLGMLFHRR